MSTYASQARSAGMGGLLGFDLPALLSIAETLGYDREMTVLLLPYAERGVQAALAAKRDGEPGSPDDDA